MYDWYPKKWWKDVDESVVKCKADEIEKFLDKVLTLRRYPETDDVSATTQAGIVRDTIINAAQIGNNMHI